MSLTQARSSDRWAGFSRPIGRASIVVISLLGIGSSAQRTSGQTQPTDSRQNIVYGTVVNAATHEPIARALVSSAGNRYATLTDGEGHFEFTLPKTNHESQGGSSTGFFSEGQPQRMWPNGSAGGLAWLTARKPGFLDDPNERRQVEAFPGSELTISLMPEALVKGRVTLSAADAAAGVSVQIFSRQVQDGIGRWVQGVSERTNSNGEFRFAELPPGSYKLVTHEWMDNDPVASVPGNQLYGFPPVYYPNAADFAAATTIQLTAGQTIQGELSLVRQPYYPVRIPVANPAVIGGMNVTVSAQGHRGPGYSLGYNPEKQRIEGLLPNGNYLVEASTFGENSATGTISLSVAGAPVEGPSMPLIRNVSIIVNVKEEFTATNWSGSGSWGDGKRTFPLRGPRVYLQVRAEAADDFGPRRGGALRQPTGAKDDSLVIDSLAPGRYWLRLNTGRGYVASATMGGTDLLREPLVIGSGSSTTIEITMRDDSAEIEGAVASGAGSRASDGAASRPLVHVYCVPLPDSTGQFLELSAPDAKFDYQMVAPGTYRVLAFKNAQTDLPYRDAEAMRAYESKGQVVHLSPGQKANVQLQVISGSE